MEAAAGQLKEGATPIGWRRRPTGSTLAEYYADELRAALTEDAEPPERYLVAPPEAPLHFKAYDGKASFDGKAVSFRWFWTGASSAKWKAGDQSFPVTGLSGVERRSPEVFEGHLRLLRREPATAQPAQADQDPAAVVFFVGDGAAVHQPPFAAGRRRVGPTPHLAPPHAIAIIRHGHLDHGGLVDGRGVHRQQGVDRRPGSAAAAGAGAAATAHRLRRRRRRPRTPPTTSPPSAPAPPTRPPSGRSAWPRCSPRPGLRLVVPGIGTTGNPSDDACCCTQASAICPGDAPAPRRPHAPAPAARRWRPRCRR